MASAPHDSPLPSAAFDAAAAGSESFVVAHDELRFDLLDGIHGHADHDEQRGAAEIKVHAQSVSHPGRQIGKEITDRTPKVIEVGAGDHELGNQGDQNQIQAADQGDASKNLVDVIGRAAARADSGNESAVFAHVVGHFVRVENNRNVKIRKEDDANTIEECVKRLAVGQPVRDRVKVAVVLEESTADHRRESKH